MEELVTWATQLGASVARGVINWLKSWSLDWFSGFVGGSISAAILALAIAKDFTINRQIVRGAVWDLMALGVLMGIALLVENCAD